MRFLYGSVERSGRHLPSISLTLRVSCAILAITFAQPGILNGYRALFYTLSRVSVEGWLRVPRYHPRVRSLPSELYTIRFRQNPDQRPQCLRSQTRLAGRELLSAAICAAIPARNLASHDYSCASLTIFASATRLMPMSILGVHASELDAKRYSRAVARVHRVLGTGPYRSPV